MAPYKQGLLLLCNAMHIELSKQGLLLLCNAMHIELSKRLVFWLNNIVLCQCTISECNISLIFTDILYV